MSYIYLLVILRSDIRKSYGTSDTTVISSTKTEARNLNAIDASAAQRDGSYPVPIPPNTAGNRHLGVLVIAIWKVPFSDFVTVFEVIRG